MPKITEEQRFSRKREIAEAAARCFRRKGFEATSMGDIIAEAGISAGSIYLHFESKQDLVHQITERILSARWMELADLPRRDPLPSPSQVVREYIDRLRANSGAEIRLHVWSTSLHDADLADLMARSAHERQRRYVDYFVAWLGSHGLDTSPAPSLAQVLIAACQGFTVQLALNPQTDQESFLAGLEWLDRAGLGLEPAHRAPEGATQKPE